MGRDREGGKKEVKGWKGRGKDLPGQCETASYAHEILGSEVFWRWTETGSAGNSLRHKADDEMLFRWVDWS